MPDISIAKPGYRCGYEWIARLELGPVRRPRGWKPMVEYRPNRCAKCKSTKWDEPKVFK
jgi:hypothetical protein